MVAEEVRIIEMSKLHCFSSSTPSISSWMGGAKEEELCNDGGVVELATAEVEQDAGQVECWALILVEECY